MKEPKICLGMMVKHEEQTLKKTIECCLPFVDHVLLSVDSESNDGTRKIAEEMADTVKTHIFATEEHPHGSFSAGRRSVIAEAQKIGCDWILQMDGHEYLSCKNESTLKSLIKDNPEIDARDLAESWGKATEERNLQYGVASGLAENLGNIIPISMLNKLGAGTAKELFKRSMKFIAGIRQKTVLEEHMLKKYQCELP